MNYSHMIFESAMTISLKVYDQLSRVNNASHADQTSHPGRIANCKSNARP